MSTKVLLVISLLFILVAGYFYANNNAKLAGPNLTPSDIDYQASQIKALQTNEQGKVSYQLTADQVVHYQQAQTALLTKPAILWQVAEDRMLSLTAATAKLDEKNLLAQLPGDVVMISRPMQSQSGAEMKVVGRDFVGNLATKQVTSQQPIVVTQANNQFKAQQLYADVGQGNYQFQQVEMTFRPANPN